MLMCSNHTAIYKMQLSAKLPGGIRLLLQVFQDLLPQSVLLPSIKAPRYDFPGSIAVG